MNFDIKKIKSLMSRIDESYEPGVDTDVDAGYNDAQSDNAVPGNSEDNEFIPNEWNPEKKGNLVGDGKLFKTFDFLAENYDDSRFDEFFKLTYLAKDYRSLANNVHSAVIGANGGFTVCTSKGNNISGISKFLLPKQEKSNTVTFFDAIYVFSFLERNGTSYSQKNGYFEDEPWGSLTSKGYGNVNESVKLAYGNMMSLIKEFDGCPILQGYMKEAYHRTSAGKKDNEALSLRRRIKTIILANCQNSIKKLDGCSRAVYENNPLDIIYIPYLDAINNDKELLEQSAIKILEELRASVEKNSHDESLGTMSDYDFWKRWGEDNNIVPENDVITSSGLDSISDEILNRLRVLINREGAANQPIDTDSADWGGNIEARDRRATIIKPSYDVAEKLGIDLGMVVSQEDIEEMRSTTLGEWLRLQQERANGSQEPAARLNARGPFSLASINKLLENLNGAGMEVDDERKEANAFDFFKEYSLASKDSKAERGLFSACQKAVGGDWVKFENTAKMRSLRRDLAPYLDKLSSDKTLSKLSLDMLTYRDTQEGVRNFVAIEYQGEQHYRPKATASISIDDLYNEHFQQAINGEVKSWPGYWKVMTTIINVSNGWGQQRALNEAQDGVYQTDRKAFLGSCISALEMAISGKDNGMLKQIVQDSCNGYTFDEEYEDSFGDWVRKDRPQDKKKPIKSSAQHFANSYYRWWCEIDTFIQSANDLAKFEKTNPSLFTVNNGKKVGKCGLFYVCPNNTRVLPIEVIGNAISNPYRAAFFSGQLSNVGLRIETITEVYNRTFRANKGKEFDLNQCISIADGKTKLIDVINGTLE